MEGSSKHFRKREAILSCLRQTHEHPSAEWVYSRLKADFPDLSLGTVYRNLALFKQQGFISSLGTVNGVERFDGNTSPHVHYICRSCGRILDLDQIQIPRQLTCAAEHCSGGTVQEYQLTFVGICKNCQNSNQEAYT